LAKGDKAERPKTNGRKIRAVCIGARCK